MRITPTGFHRNANDLSFPASSCLFFPLSLYTEFPTCGPTLVGHPLCFVAFATHSTNESQSPHSTAHLLLFLGRNGVFILVWLLVDVQPTGRGRSASDRPREAAGRTAQVEVSPGSSRKLCNILDEYDLYITCRYLSHQICPVKDIKLAY